MAHMTMRYCVHPPGSGNVLHRDGRIEADMLRQAAITVPVLVPPPGHVSVSPVNAIDSPPGRSTSWTRRKKWTGSVTCSSTSVATTASPNAGRHRVSVRGSRCPGAAERVGARDIEITQDHMAQLIGGDGVA